MTSVAPGLFACQLITAINNGCPVKSFSYFSSSSQLPAIISWAKWHEISPKHYLISYAFSGKHRGVTQVAGDRRRKGTNGLWSEHANAVLHMKIPVAQCYNVPRGGWGFGFTGWGWRVAWGLELLVCHGSWSYQRLCCVLIFR